MTVRRVVVKLLVAIGGLAAAPGIAQDASATRPALTVTLARAESARLPMRLLANGTVAAWQEAIIGAEVGGLRLAEVRAAVGDVVRRGQVLAVFSAETVEAELAQGDRKSDV